MMTEWGEYGWDDYEYGRDINVNARLQWSGDPLFDNLEQYDVEHLAQFAGEEDFEEYEDDDYSGWFKNLTRGIKKGVRSAAGTIKVVAKPVALVAAGAVSAVVFPPAAPVFATAAAQAAVAGVVAAQIESSIPERRRKGQATLAATRKLSENPKASPVQRKAALAAVHGITIAANARRMAGKKKTAFVVTKRGLVVRVK